VPTPSSTDLGTFTWRGQTLDYFDAHYNSTRLNERAVELAIARHWLDGRTGDGLEVGNVTSHYWPVDHRVVDLHEQAPYVDNLDMFEVEGAYDWILTISTVEHVHWDDDRDPNGAVNAIHHLRSLLRPGGALLVTAPTGWNPGLDEAIRREFFAGPGVDQAVYVRNPAVGDWSPAKTPVTPHYGGATYLWANAVWIAEFTNEDDR